MSAEPELWLLLYTLSGFVVLLLAISAYFSLIDYLLQPWFDQREKSWQALPPHQYFQFFVFPLLATVMGGLVNVGTGLLMSDGPDSIPGIAFLSVAIVVTYTAAQLALLQLSRTRRYDPIKLARSDNPASMRFALAELVRSVNTLMADAPILDIRRARFDSEKLREIYDKLVDLTDELRQQEPAQRLVTRSREQAAEYTRLVTLATLAAAMLAIVATVVRIVAEGGVLRATSLGAFLLLLAAGLWWAGMWLRAKTHANRYAALKEQLTTGLSKVRSGLDDINQHICKEITGLGREAEQNDLASRLHGLQQIYEEHIGRIERRSIETMNRQIEVTEMEVARVRRLFSDELDVLREQLRRAASQTADLSSDSLRAHHSANEAMPDGSNSSIRDV